MKKKKLKQQLPFQACILLCLVTKATSSEHAHPWRHLEGAFRSSVVVYTKWQQPSLLQL